MKIKGIRKKIHVATLSVYTLAVLMMPINIILSPLSVYAEVDCSEAAQEARADFYSKNDIQFVNPCESGCSANSAPGSLEFSSEDEKKILEEILKFYTGEGMTLMQASAIAGNFKQESGFNPTITNSIGAYGLAQWLGGRKTNLHAKPNYDTVQVQLEFSMEELFGSEKAALDKFLAYSGSSVSELAVVFGEAYERYGTNEEGKRGEFAAQIYADYQGQIPDGTGLTGAGSSAPSAVNCGSSDGAVNGDIARTAINLSWPDRTHSVNDPKPEYVKAMEDVGLTNAGCGPNGADCGVFVATVMRASKADEDFPIGTSIIINYLRNNAEYEKIPNLGDTSNLMPGDIFIINGHTMFYSGDVGSEDGGKNMPSASCSERIADRGSNIYFSDSRGTYEIYRKK